MYTKWSSTVLVGVQVRIPIRTWIFSPYFCFTFRVLVTVESVSKQHKISGRVSMGVVSGFLFWRKPINWKYLDLHLREMKYLRNLQYYTRRQFVTSTGQVESRDSSAGIALDYGLDDWGSRVRSPAGARKFSLYYCDQNGSGDHPASYPMGTRGFFPGGKAAGAWSWPLASVYCQGE
jgi:hypothetical protein